MSSPIWKRERKKTLAYEQARVNSVRRIGQVEPSLWVYWSLVWDFWSVRVWQQDENQVQEGFKVKKKYIESVFGRTSVLRVQENNTVQK